MKTEKIKIDKTTFEIKPGRYNSSISYADIKRAIENRINNTFSINDRKILAYKWKSKARSKHR